jgi:lipopolysaccharide transport system ATP-binding protein
MSTVIKVEDLSKLYRLGTIGTGTLSHDINRWWSKVRGKEDPYQKIGTVNDRTSKADSDYVWSIKDINFEVKQGEVLGIIGKNGAGKSTLLKILSRVTTPTTGQVKVKGRIASLLEVGTGFHPELTGRENIFLNGAILGMTKTEIINKFDEIVDFSGVERYIDTPVKRYSSGMYVRLAFAVAAHLESEILIVDEVLAVGDAEFQKKCLGKMKDVSGQGRTVLFVSHNMGMIQTLTEKVIYLEKGSVKFKGTTAATIEQYSIDNISQLKSQDLSTRVTNSLIKFISFTLLNEYENKVYTAFSGLPTKFEINILNESNKTYNNCSIGIGIFSLKESFLLGLKSDLLEKYYTIKPGLNKIICSIEKFPLSKGIYKYNLIINDYASTFDWVQDAGFFEVESGPFFSTGKIPAENSQTVLIDHQWS